MKNPNLEAKSTAEAQQHLAGKRPNRGDFRRHPGEGQLPGAVEMGGRSRPKVVPMGSLCGLEASQPPKASSFQDTTRIGEEVSRGEWGGEREIVG